MSGSVENTTEEARAAEWMAGLRSRASKFLAMIRNRLRSLPKGPVIAIALYVVFAFVLNWPTWPGDPNRVRTNSFGALGAVDFDQQLSLLAWNAHALVHGLNPFFTNVFNYPSGIDIAENTSVPLLGVLTAPVTLLVSPVASMNLLVWLSFPLSATAAFFVLRRFVSWDVAAFLGGTLYGFSPWILTQGLYHLNLCFVPLPPLILLAAYELFQGDERHRLRWGVALGVLVVAQFFISPEICTLTLICAVIGAILLGISSRQNVWPAIVRSWRGIAAACGISVVILAYPVYVTFYGAGSYVGLPPPGPGGEGADLLSPLLPTSSEVFTLGHLGVIGNGLVFGNTSENGNYLGLPLLILMLLIVIKYWRRPWVRFCALMVLVTFVLSLGDHLDIDNSRTAVPLPDNVIQNLVIFRNIIQVRFGLLVTFFAGAVVALGADEMHHRMSLPADDDDIDPLPLFGVAVIWARARLLLIYSLWALCVLTLLPRIFSSAPAYVPQYFTSGAADRIPANSVVLMSPYPSIYDVDPLLWQAVADDRFKAIGGYGTFSTGPAAGNGPVRTPPTLTPTDVQDFLLYENYGLTNSGAPNPTLGRQLECDAQSFLLNYHVATVITGPRPTPLPSNSNAVEALFRYTLGPASFTDGRVKAWYHVKRDITSNTAHLKCAG